MPSAEPLREGDPAAVGPYRLLGRLGAGGQGIVYLGQGPDGRPVAVKVLREGRADERFAKEIEAARRVEPFCIAQVLDASGSGRPYIVTEYVEGPSLQQAGRHAGADLQRLAVATATALAAVHQAGIVHRDFKPANVLLGPGGPRVIDFGIARPAGAGPSGASGIVGTPAYMAPEQLAGTPIGPAADVFAWGSVMVFAGTGSPPFGEDTLPAVINRVLHNEPRLGDLPQPLRAIVLECLTKDPVRRPSMQDVLLRLLGDPRPRPGNGVPAGAGFGGSGPAGPGLGGGTPGSGYGAPGFDGGGPVGRGPGSGGMATAPGRSGRRSGPWIVAGAAGAVALAVAGTAVWGVANGWIVKTPRPTAESLAIATNEDPKPTATPTRPKRTRKPTSPRPTRKPTVEPPERPTRQSTASAPPTRTAKPSKSATSGASFRIPSLSAQGARKANTQDCQVGQTITFAVVEGTKLRTTFTYEWILDGKVVMRSEGSTTDVHTQRATGPLIKTNGPHTITLRLTSPATVSRTLNFTVCPAGTE
ncbi:protein kinase [Nonomuraea sp. NPDC005983]|uniref:serine/threonine protein kinase n=1 Tax=Nonomuraea sp. NPDC005983 TaxID=3155595 RepID=UPI0033A79520